MDLPKIRVAERFSRDNFPAMLSYAELVTYLKPETAAEEALLALPEFQEGLHWGVPRYGHPEGEVYKHVREVLRNIDFWVEDASARSLLRLVAIVHDTFKFREAKGWPRDWNHHHSILAARFLEVRGEDATLIRLVAWHDEAYFIWRMMFPYQQPIQAQVRLAKLLELIQDEIQLYYVFFKCDTCTGDKNLAPLHWFEQQVPGLVLLPDNSRAY